MATSSLYKSFVIKTKAEAKNFVKLFIDQEKKSSSQGCECRSYFKRAA